MANHIVPKYYFTYYCYYDFSAIVKCYRALAYLKLRKYNMLYTIHFKNKFVPI